MISEREQLQRIRLVMFMVLSLMLIMVGRLFYLQIQKHEFFKERVTSQVRSLINLPAKRGNIYDRHGLLLAGTIDAFSVYVNCPEVSDKSSLVKTLAPLLGMDNRSLQERLNHKYFILVKRKVDDETADKIKAAKLLGVYLLPDQKRVYLRDRLASHVVGFVDIDNAGQGGIEHNFEKYLQGIPGKVILERDPLGMEIYSGTRIVQDSRDGDSVELSIDEFLQYITAKELRKASERLKAENATATIMDVRTGEILAMVSLPDYDPNKFYEYAPECRRNNVVHTVYEPGSVFKLITMAAALEQKVISLNETLIVGEKFAYGDREIREAHPLKDPYRPRLMQDILIESFNIGAAKVGLKLGKLKLYDYILKFNFGKRTGIELSGESAGIIHTPAEWAQSDEMIIPFGQSFAVTPLQMMAAVAVIANDGEYVQPRIVRRVLDNKGQVLKDFSKQTERHRIVSAETARQLRAVMQESVARGTGGNAAVEGYTIAGKTGTSQKTDPVKGGYLADQYISSFAGLIPGNRPRLVILVTLNNPRGAYYGGEVAAPIFKEIAKEAVRYLAIPYDN